MKLSPFVSAVLIPPMLVWPISGQTVAPPVDGELTVHVVASDGSRVPAGAHTGKGIGVEVTDSSGNAIADAAVAIRFPEDGATAYFKDGSHSAVAYTDAAGHAMIRDFQYANLAGSIALRITASKGNAHAGLMMEQSAVNTVAPEPVRTRALPIPASGADAPIGLVADGSAGQPDEDVLASVPQTPRGTTLAPIAVPVPDRTTAVQPPAAQTINSATGTSLPESPLVAENVAAPPPVPGMLPRPGHLTIAPAISITSPDSYAGAYHHSFGVKKWIILGLIAGAGVGAAMALGGGGSKTATPTSSGLSVGAPTISIGHP